ncbi:MAG: cysteine--tRNA ligase [Syntrophomonadaceae bacterium]|nr:cysteine--tRNA ligase [Syntrophomonadaceae bacterium]MDD4549337.1 cysteine--tRNA ligase [Syntrophomonadaceae bacterium]
MLRVYNTLSGRKEELKTIEPEKVGIYVCGPTTYNYIHLGNGRPLVIFDTVRRYLRFKGYDVKYVQNFTDVDDKIINRAIEEGRDPVEMAGCYIEEYFKDADALNVIRADIHPRVSQHIPDIIKVIDTLIEKGFAYEVEGDVYYRVRAFKDYGKLSGRSLEDMVAGARIAVDERKEDPMDFALWKAAKKGEPYWESPWGKGRPGWHIECSVMSTKYLGDTFDIHGGGSDLIFPHHENEIAQAEAYTGKPFVNYWIHNGFITVNNEKMSKSLGNFFVLRDILDKYPADVVRFYLIATHYRSPLDFDDGKLEEARKALGRLKTTMVLAEEFITGDAGETAIVGENPEQLLTRINELEDKFIEAMDDDFNTARAIGYLFEISHSINAYIAVADHNNAAERAAVKKAAAVLKELGDVLGIFFTDNKDEEVLIEKILGIMARLRQNARKDRDYQLADNIRDFLKNLGISVEDNDSGSRFRYENLPEMGILIENLIDLRNKFKQDKAYDKADYIRDSLKDEGIILEDTREGVRWKFAEA